jgi:hypothetical protein
MSEVTGINLSPEQLSQREEYDQWDVDYKIRSRIGNFLLGYATKSEDGILGMSPIRNTSVLIQAATDFNDIADKPLARPLPHRVPMSLIEFEYYRSELNTQVEPVLMQVFDFMAQGAPKP